MKHYSLFFPTPHVSADRLTLESIGTLTNPSTGRPHELLRVESAYINGSAIPPHDCPLDLFAERLHIMRRTGSLDISEEDYLKLISQYGIRPNGWPADNRYWPAYARPKEDHETTTNQN